MSEETRFERARKPSQIEHRRQSILDAAAAIFAADGVEKATLTAIAKLSGVSKASIYRYFESREEIFLTLLLDDLFVWVDDVERGLMPLSGADDDTAVVDVLVDAMLRHDRFAELSSVLTTVLERNVSKDRIRSFKRTYIQTAFRLVNAANAALTSLDHASVMAFLQFFLLFASGLRPSANPPPHVAEVMAEPEFQALCIDLETSLREHARVHLAGLRALSAKPPGQSPA